MKIGIEARMMGAENTRGLGRYIQELLAAMLEIEKSNEYVLVTKTDKHPFAGNPRVKTVVADIPWYGIQEQISMPRILGGLGADLVHIPHWNVPLAFNAPFVVTIHDLLLKHQPGSAKTSTRSWPVRAMKNFGFDLALGHAVKKSSKICVPTEFSKEDLLSFYPGLAEKIVVTGEGIPSLASSDSFQPVGKDYLLYVGSAYPHKRLDLLLEVWREVSGAYPKLELVFAGERDAFMNRIESQAKGMNLERIKFLGKVGDDELSRLYTGALALAWPSSFEGFGLVPVEALAHGCPVVSSDATCMPEVLGKSGVVYFKSGSKDGMIQAVKTVVDNQVMIRQDAVDAGRELSERHSWKKAASKTLEVYNSAVFGQEAWIPKSNQTKLRL